MRMVAAVLDGRPFMGQPTCKTPVIYLTEQPASSFREALKMAGLLERRDLSVLPWNKAIGCSWTEVIGAAVAECKRLGARLLIVDTLHQFVQLPGDAENNSGDALEAVRPLQKAMAEGIAIVLLIHDRKSGGDVGDSGRGSSAFAGAADILLSLRSLEGKGRRTLRQVQALSRFSETPADMIIELTSEGYISRGGSHDVATAEAEATILTTAPGSEDGAMNLDRFIEITGVGRTTAQRAIEALLSKQQLMRIGGGKKGDPHRYWAPKMVSAQTACLIGQKANGRGQSSIECI
jgi:hypothetical protein